MKQPNDMQMDYKTVLKNDVNALMSKYKEHTNEGESAHHKWGVNLTLEACCVEDGKEKNNRWYISQKCCYALKILRF